MSTSISSKKYPFPSLQPLDGRTCLARNIANGLSLLPGLSFFSPHCSISHRGVVRGLAKMERAGVVPLEKMRARYRP